MPGCFYLPWQALIFSYLLFVDSDVGNFFLWQALMFGIIPMQALMSGSFFL